MKKTIKKLLCVTAAFALLAVFLAACGDGGSPYAGEYSVPEFGGKEMYIATWYGPMGFSANRDGIQELKDAGVNLGITNFMPSESLLDIAGDIGFKLLPHYKEFADGFASFESYADHPALLGINAWDEPHFSDFESVLQSKNAFDELMPADKLFFVNLYPGYANIADLGGSFEYYVDTYLETVKPPMVSIDHYPLVKSESIQGATEINNSYFSDIETVRHSAKRHGDIPMWSIILTSGHGSLVSPGVAELRWQMAVNMAFGVEALVHYTYPQESADYKSMVTVDGKRTEVFDRVQEANLELRKWDNVYLSFNWEATAEVEGRSGGTPGDMIRLAYAPEIKDIDGITSVVSSENLLLGAFSDASGNRGFMLTNATNPWQERFAVTTVKFDKRYKGVMVYEKGEPRIIGLNGSGEAKIRLDAGEGKFLIPLKAK